MSFLRNERTLGMREIRLYTFIWLVLLVENGCHGRIGKAREGSERNPRRHLWSMEYGELETVVISEE